MKIDGINSTTNSIGNSYVTETRNAQYTPDISSSVSNEEVVAANVVESNQKNTPSENHEETNRVTIKIVDKNSDKVIKEFPAEETLDMIAKVWELAGVFLDEKG